MISLPNILKGPEMKERVLDYGFTWTFENLVIKKEDSERPEEQAESEEKVEYPDAAVVYEDALRQAQEVLDQAREEAEIVLQEAREKGHKEGYEAGFEEGRQKAYEDHKTELDAKMDEFQTTMGLTIKSVTDEKEKILEKYIDDLKKVTMTIAEKVIQTSLKSSGEIIKRMIVAAAGKLKKTQWVKIYVSQKDAGLMVQGDTGLLNELSHISGNVKIVAMEHAEDGTCIIELPEEVIDVSVNTQLENIKGILNNARL